MANTREKATALLPLVDRMHRGHCWIKTADGPRRLDAALDEFKLAEHAAKRKAYGLCPIVPGTNTCRVACLDLDSHQGDTAWPDMVLAAESIEFVLQQDGYETHIYRSSGGKGIHIYLLWEDNQDAYSVRQMLTTAITSLGYAPGTGGVAAKQIEIFPKQDAVPLTGYGSMFVLPGAGESKPLSPDDLEWKLSTPVPQLTKPERTAPVLTDSPTLQLLQSALDAIPNHTDPLEYDDWRNVVFGIHHATEGSDDGLALAHAFSARSSKYEPEFLDDRVWPYVGINADNPITERTLYALAATYGWVDPTVADDFEVIPGDPPPKDDFTAIPEAEHSDLSPVKQRFRVLGEDEFLSAPPVEWLIKNLLPRADLGILFGESGSGKSFIALDLAIAISLGTPWRGHKAIKGRVVYVASEGAGGLRNRVRAYKDYHDIDSTGVQVIADAPNLMEKDDALDICKSILQGGKADLIIIDTLAQSMQGNENSGEDVGRVLAHCKGIRKATGAMVLLVHHSGKDSSRGARGWSGLRAAGDVELEVVRSDDDRVITVTKQKDGEDGGEFGFKLEVVPVGVDSDGDTITSCVVSHGEVVRKVKAKGANQKLAVSVFEDLLGLSDGVDGVQREDWIVNLMAAMEVPEGGRDRRREIAIKAIESLKSTGQFAISGTLFSKGVA